jgi:hypothetical protein
VDFGCECCCWSCLRTFLDGNKYEEVYIYFITVRLYTFVQQFFLSIRILIGILEMFSSSKKGVYSIKVKADLLYFVGQGEMKSRTTGIYFTEK